MNPEIVVAIFYGLSGTILVLLGFAIYRDNAHERLNRITSLMLLWGGLGALFGASDLMLQQVLTVQNWQNFQIYRELAGAVWEFFFPQLLLFALIFPEDNPHLTRNKWLPFAIFVPHGLHFLVIFLAPQLFHHSEVYFTALTSTGPDLLKVFLKLFGKFLELSLSLHKQLFSLVNFIFFLLALLLLYTSMRRLEQAHLKQQVRLVFVGIGLAGGLYAALILLPLIFGLEIRSLLRTGLTAIGLLAGSGSIAVAIVRYRFLDINLLLRKSVFYSFSAALVGGVYLVVVRYFDQIVSGMFQQQIPLFEIAFFIFALVFFQPLMTWLEDFMDTVFLRGGRDYRVSMQEFSREIITILDFDQLKRKLVDQLIKTMLTEQVILYLPGEHSEAFIPVTWVKKLPEWQPLPFDHPLIRQIAAANEPVLAANMLRLFVSPEAAAEARTLLQSLDAYLIVPIKRQDQLRGFISLGQKITKVRYGYEDMTVLTVLSSQLAVAFENVRLYHELAGRERAKKEMEIAQRIQQTLLPPRNPSFPGLQMSSVSLPAIEVGGDYFDFFTLPSKNIGIVIADVAGKGVFGAVYMAMVRSLVRAYALQTDSPREAIILVNTLLRRDSDRHLFVSLFYAILDIRTKTLRYVRAGHNEPIFIAAKESKGRFLPGRGMALGVTEGELFANNLIEESVSMASNDLLLLYTDGISEAMNGRQEEFGEERLLELVEINRHVTAEELMTKILDGVNSFVGPVAQHDDMTMIALKIL